MTTPVNKSELARALRISRPSLNKYLAEGLPADDLPAALAWVEARKAVETRGGTARNTGETGGKSSYNELKEQLLRANIAEREASARLKEFEVETAGRNLVSLDEAKHYVAEVLSPLRSLLDSLPKSIAARANPADPALAEEAVRSGLDSVFRAMTAAAKTTTEDAPP